VFEQERLSYDPSCATRAEEFGDGNEQMDRQDQHIAHERQINTSADQHKTEPGRDFCQKNYEFATHRMRFGGKSRSHFGLTVGL
jgi:hypothetical protein